MPPEADHSTDDSTDEPRSASRWNGTNPFYVLLVLVGALFVVTCFAYTVMAVNQRDVEHMMASRQSSLIRLMEQHGLNFLIAELIVLAICTFAAIGTDEFWTKIGEARERANAGDSSSADAGDSAATPNSTAISNSATGDAVKSKGEKERSDG